MKVLFDGVKEFSTKDFENNKDLFDKLKDSQFPHTLFIGCSDSRVVPVMITKSNPGDLFVNKAPATSIGILAEALRQMANSKSPINVIGTRHGEKLYETLCTREEMTKAEERGYQTQMSLYNLLLNLFHWFV